MENDQYITIEQQKQVAKLEEDIRRINRLLRFYDKEDKAEHIEALRRQIEWDINAIQKIIGG
ncbi:MAG: hypothetical protein IH594_18400 [Bacteroidales bacterium]|nr:hypothetical protein [Bacteroidales bacterium]